MGDPVLRSIGLIRKNGGLYHPSNIFLFSVFTTSNKSRLQSWVSALQSCIADEKHRVKGGDGHVNVLPLLSEASLTTSSTVSLQTVEVTLATTAEEVIALVLRDLPPVPSTASLGAQGPSSPSTRVWAVCCTSMLLFFVINFCKHVSGRGFDFV